MGWVETETNKPSIGPNLNEICTVSGFPKPGYICLEEYDHIIANNDDTNNYEITQFREIQPPLDIDIETIIEENITA
jgi:hypothetical protein